MIFFTIIGIIVVASIVGLLLLIGFALLVGKLAEFEENISNMSNPVEINQDVDIVLADSEDEGNLEIDDEEETVCEYCLGTGEVGVDERDSDGNWQRGVGTEICICKLQDEPADFSGSSNDDR